MRRSLAKFPYPVIGRATSAATLSPISSAFSTSSSGGGGGRGRGGSNPFQLTAEEPQNNNSKQEDASPVSHGHGHGRGRGQLLPSSPAFSPLPGNGPNRPPHGRGRGFIPSNYPSPSKEESESPDARQKPNAKMPFLFVKDEASQDDSPESGAPVGEPKILPGDIINVLSGAGRGKPGNIPVEKPKAENRHIRQRPPKPPARSAAAASASADGDSVDKSSLKVELSQEEKVKKAVGILSKGDEGSGGGRGEASGTRGGRGRGRGRGRGTRRGDEEYGEPDDGDDGSGDEDDLSEFGVGDDADGEKLAEKLGPEKMSELAEAFEIAVDRVLPDPEGYEDDLLDALHANYLIECEPEYRMEEFGTNPDIDDTPPIPLREAFEKMKPFLMAYEGIQSHEEWEEIIEATMKTVPLMKKIIDDYGGPDRVTAKQQMGELDRVAKTLPASAPASVKRFTDRAVLSLQSNPGWGWDKKCQFMDKLVLDVKQQYK